MRRIRVLQWVLFAGVGIIWLGFFGIQGIRGAYYRERSERNRTRLIHLPAARGDILDRRGTPLAEDRLTFELAVLPQELQDPDETWKRLGFLLHLSPEDLARKYRSGFEARFSPVTLVRDLPRETAFRLEEERGHLPGILVRPVPRRAYPLGQAIGPVSGYLGLIAKEELTRLQPYGYSFRDWIGKDGLEQRYDPLLRGKDGGMSVEVNAHGNVVQQLGFRPPERGRTIHVSIDGRLQEVCHRLLSGGEGAILVMDSGTGELLALASSPSVDPNAFVEPGRDPEVRHMLRDPGRPLFNRATRAMVPPGSTFKAVIAYEALRERKILAGSAFECPGHLHLGGAVFRCWQEQGHGPQRVTEALQHSCNVFFYQTGRRLGADKIAQAARLFRLNHATGVDLPREAKGFVPDPAWMRQRRQQVWREGDTVSFAIGQGALQVTPLQMLLLFNAIATDGQLPHPHLLLRSEAELLSSSPPVRAGGRLQRGSDSRFRGNDDVAHLALDAAAVSEVKKGLELVIGSETGTGRLAQLPGVRVAGKTGTAQVPQGLPHAWFCGYAPASAPKVSFVIFLEHGGKGGLQAARMAGQLLTTLKEMDYL